MSEFAVNFADTLTTALRCASRLTVDAVSRDAQRSAIPLCAGAQYRSKRRSRRGFTLIEVLATLMLLAIVLPAVMRGITISSAAGNAAKRRTDAGALAESKVNELIATGNWQTATLSGDFGTDWPDYTWNAVLSAWGQGQGVDGTNVVQQLDVQVLWKIGGKQESVTVSTLVYQSANATGGSTSTGASSTGGSS